MPTTNKTTGSNTSTLQFNPIAQKIYESMIGGGSRVLGGYMNDPFGNEAYRMGSAESQRGAQQAGQNNMGSLLQNMLTSGMGQGMPGQAFKSAQMAQTGRANQSMSSQANIQNVMQAMQRQMMAAGTGMSFSPQLTGQTGSFSQSQTTSGLGTWLPQLAAAISGTAMKAASGGMGGGGGFGMSGGFAGGANGAPAMNSSWLNSGNNGSGNFNSMMAGMGSGGLASMTMGGGGQAPPPPWMTQP